MVLYTLDRQQVGSKQAPQHQERPVHHLAKKAEVEASVRHRRECYIWVGVVYNRTLHNWQGLNIADTTDTRRVVRWCVVRRWGVIIYRRHARVALQSVATRALPDTYNRDTLIILQGVPAWTLALRRNTLVILQIITRGARTLRRNAGAVLEAISVCTRSYRGSTRVALQGIAAGAGTLRRDALIVLERITRRTLCLGRDAGAVLHSVVARALCLRRDTLIVLERITRRTLSSRRQAGTALQGVAAGARGLGWDAGTVL